MIIYGTNNGETLTDVKGQSHISAAGGDDLIILADEFIWELIDGGEGSDTISYVNLYGVGVDIGNVEDGDGYCADTLDSLRSIENVFGSNGDDRLRGGSGGNELFGLDGDDLFEGRGGADKLSGGSGFDTATYDHAASGVTINLVSGNGFGGEAQGDKLSGIERLIGSSHADHLLGNAVRNVLEGGNGADLLEGGYGNDVLSGGAGADVLLGGRGGDKLTGGGGADVFRFYSTGESYSHYLLPNEDVITDFNHSTGDRIDLSVIDARPGMNGNQAFSFIGDDAFNAVGQVRAYFENGDVIVEVNASSAAGAEMSFVVSDIVTLSDGDFIL